MKKETNRNSHEQSKKNVSLHQDVLCACNGSECEGSCRETHLQNNRTGICIAAYNKPKSRFNKIENSELESYGGVFEF